MGVFDHLLSHWLESKYKENHANSCLLKKRNSLGLRICQFDLFLTSEMFYCSTSRIITLNVFCLSSSGLKSTKQICATQELNSKNKSTHTCLFINKRLSLHASVDINIYTLWLLVFNRWRMKIHKAVRSRRYEIECDRSALWFMQNTSLKASLKWSDKWYKSWKMQHRHVVNVKKSFRSVFGV